MNLLVLSLMCAICTTIEAISFSTVASVSVALLSLNRPAQGFFGLFRRRKSPVLETKPPVPPPNPFGFPGQPGGFMNQYGGGGFGGGGNMFFPGMNAPQFGMYGQNRFPPQFKPPLPMKPQQGFPPQQQFPPQGFPPQQFPPQQGQPKPPVHTPSQPPMTPPQFPPEQPFNQQSDSEDSDPDMESEEFGDSQGDEAPGMNTEEAESFFTLLAETDENKCISRLVCEMGANPESGGEFGKTIVDIIGSLNDFPDGSKVSEYNEVLSIGVAEGLSTCLSKFSMCDDESFDLVKNGQMDEEGQ